MAIDINFGALQTPNPFAAFAQGQEVGQQQRLRQAQQAAGNLFATDPDKAAQLLASAGDIEGATNIQRIAASRKAATSRAQAAQQYSGGDVAGAQNTALASGDSEFLTAISKLSDEQKDAAKERAQSLASVGYSLSKMPYEQRKAWLATNADQVAATVGMKPDALRSYDPTDQNISTSVSQAIGIAKQIELSKPVEMDPTKNYYQSNLGGGAPPPQGAPAQGAPPQAMPASAPDAVWAAMKHREVQNGDGNAVSPQGAIGSTQMLPATAHGIAQKLGVTWRPDLMQGNSSDALAYQDKLGRAYFQEGLDRYGGDVAKAASYYHGGPNERQWGPKTQAYAQAVTGGAQGGQGDAQPYQVAANGQTPPPPSMPGYHMIQQAQPQWKADGQGALINPITGDQKRDPHFAAPVAAKSGVGQGGVGAVDPNIVKGLIEGRITPPTQKAAASDYWQAQLQAAAAQDPNFDMVNFQARAKARADFTSGKSAQNITALNTVIGHLDHLDRTIDGLNNTDNLGPLNKLNNMFAHQIADASGTDSRVKNFETAKTAVANELTRVFRGSGGAEADIQAWQKQLNGASSPKALHGVVQSMAELINSRIQALGEQYSQGMGTTKDPITLLTPDKQKAFTRMIGGSSAPAPAAPKSASSQVIRYDAQGNRIK